MEGHEEVIADTSLLSNFARSGHLNLLKRLFPNGVWVTEGVREEIARGTAKYPELQELLETEDLWLKVVKELEPDEEQEKQRLQNQHKGIRKGADATVLAVAKVRKWKVLTDDDRGGKGMVSIARQEGIKVLRSQELLKLAVCKGLISRQEAQQIWQDMATKARYPRILEGQDLQKEVQR